MGNRWDYKRGWWRAFIVNRWGSEVEASEVVEIMNAYCHEIDELRLKVASLETQLGWGQETTVDENGIECTPASPYVQERIRQIMENAGLIPKRVEVPDAAGKPKIEYDGYGLPVGGNELPF